MSKNFVKYFTLLALLSCVSKSNVTFGGVIEELDLANTPHFCGEPLPLHKKNVSQRFLRVVKGGFVKSLPKLKKTAYLHFKIIEPILQKHAIPKDFKYLCLIESTFTSNATSHKGALGYWQFMPETAREMGLKVNKNTDERLDLVKSTHAACRYFKKLHAQLGSWTLVAVAYNAGLARINDYMKQAQSMSYYDWRTNAETSQYLYRVIAVKEWFTAPERFQYWASMPLSSKSSHKTPNKMLVEVEVVEDLEEETTQSPIQVETVPQQPEPSVAPLLHPEGIHTSLKTATTIPQKGQTWVFEISEDKMFGNQPVAIGDRLYAEVSGVNLPEGIITLQCIQLYSPQKHQMYRLELTTTIQTNITKNQSVIWQKN